jgi:ATP-dependent DNA helicase RecQ
MIGYIKKATGCRSQHIAHYFTDTKINACGLCDNCINERVAYISTEEFNSIANQIRMLTDRNSVPVEHILASLKGVKKEKIWSVIDYLQAEEKLKTDEDGNLCFRDKWQPFK